MKNIVIAVLLLLLAATGSFVYLALQDTDSGLAAKISALTGSAEPKEEAPRELQIYTIEKVLLTLPEPGQTSLHHAQLDVVLTSFDPKAVATLKKLDPLLRNIIVESFSDKTFSQLRETKNINELQSGVQSAVVANLAKYQLNLELLDVKFSKMVVQ